VVRAPWGGSPGSQAMFPESVLKPVARAVAAEAESVAGPGGKPCVTPGPTLGFAPSARAS
jgi:hypothetical protein